MTSHDRDPVLQKINELMNKFLQKSNLIWCKKGLSDQVIILEMARQFNKLHFSFDKNYSLIETEWRIYASAN